MNNELLWLAIYRPPLDDHGRPAAEVRTYGGAPYFEKFGADWLFLDAFDAARGVVLSVEHGDVFLAEDCS